MISYPSWSNHQYAEAIGRCRKWVQKWKKRLQDTDPEDQSVLHSHSRVRKRPPAPYHPKVIRRILELRDNPPKEVPRKLGPKPILYFLHQDEALKAYRLPRSSSTIWQILDTNQRILRLTKTPPQPFERPEPMDTWEIDFTDVERYYIKRALAGRYVVCRLDAHQQTFEVDLGQRIIKSIPIKGLYDGTLEFGDYLTIILDEAESEERRLMNKRRLRAS